MIRDSGPDKVQAGAKIAPRSWHTPFRKKPDFFIVGAPKCGTTALNHYLSLHPDVFMARKETHYFGADLQFGPQLQFYRRYPAEYGAEFALWNGQAYAGETSVWYLFSKQAAVEIKAFNSDARIIIMLREPVSMLYSLYCQFVADGNEYLPSFEQALAAEEDRRAGRRLGRQTYLVEALDYRATARFSEQVKRYFDVFGRDRVKVIIYDDFNADTAGIYSSTLDFLGLGPGPVDRKFEVINGNVNGNHSVRSSALRAVLNDPLVRRTAINLRAWLPRPLFSALKNSGIKLNELNFNNCPRKRRPIEAELQQSLRSEFASEVERLSELLGRDLTHWTKPKQELPPAEHLRAIQKREGLLTGPGFEAA